MLTPSLNLTNKRIGKPQMNVIDLFHEYQRVILDNAKKSDKDMIKEVFANTELFDISHADSRINYKVKVFSNPNNLFCSFETPLVLPFESCFIKVYDDEEETNGVFIREHDPFNFTGAVFIKTNRFGLKYDFTIPFTLNIDLKQLIIGYQDLLNVVNDLTRKTGNNLSYLKPNEVTELINIQFTDVYQIVSLALQTINSVKEYVTLVDQGKSDYYSFKGKPTIKKDRIIYYLIEKKIYKNGQYNIQPRTRLEYSHAFSVRGHWRRFDGIGKDRQGNRKVQGFTWVKDFIKGEGELIKKVRLYK